MSCPTSVSWWFSGGGAAQPNAVVVVADVPPRGAGALTPTPGRRNSQLHARRCIRPCPLTLRLRLSGRSQPSQSQAHLRLAHACGLALARTRGLGATFVLVDDGRDGLKRRREAVSGQMARKERHLEVVILLRLLWLLWRPARGAHVANDLRPHQIGHRLQRPSAGLGRARSRTEVCGGGGLKNGRFQNSARPKLGRNVVLLSKEVRYGI